MDTEWLLPIPLVRKVPQWRGLFGSPLLLRVGLPGPLYPPDLTLEDETMSLAQGPMRSPREIQWAPALGMPLELSFSPGSEPTGSEPHPRRG